MRKSNVGVYLDDELAGELVVKRNGFVIILDVNQKEYLLKIRVPALLKVLKKCEDSYFPWGTITFPHTLPTTDVLINPYADKEYYTVGIAVFGDAVKNRITRFRKRVYTTIAVLFAYLTGLVTGWGSLPEWLILFQILFFMAISAYLAKFE